MFWGRNLNERTLCSVEFSILLRKISFIELTSFALSLHCGFYGIGLSNWTVFLYFYPFLFAYRGKIKKALGSVAGV